jgi:cyclase
MLRRTVACHPWGRAGFGGVDLIRDRRQFLSWGLAASSALCAPALLPIRAWAAARLTLTPLTGRLSLVQGAAANIVVASANGELVLVDGGAAVDAAALQKLLAKHYPGHRLRAVFNTHWHAAHTGFNAAARQLGCDVVAHENTRLWLTTTVNSRWEGKIYPPQPAAAWPNRTFIYNAQQFDFGGGAIQYAHLGPAHTDGDIYVRFAEENVIVTGDVLSPGRYPQIDTACNGYLGGINSALRAIAALCNDQTRLVPGSGPVVDVASLQQQEEMGNFVLTRMSESLRKGNTFAEFVATQPTKDFDARFGDPARFLKLAWDSSWYQVNPMGGLATGQPPAPAGRAR